MSRKTRPAPTASQPSVLALVAGQVGEIARRLIALEKRMEAIDGQKAQRDG
jgi:hypothetical protein